MKYKVVITKSANVDIRKAVAYIEYELDNHPAAVSFIDKTEKLIHSLSEMPKRYPLADDYILHNQGVRMVPINNYLLFYSVTDHDKTVSVLRVLYARSNWLILLKGNIE